MQAIILAAGMGKRLKELTADATKCMVKVNGVALIDRMLAQLDSLALERIVIVVGYQAQKLIDYIETLGINTPIIYVENSIYDKTNNIYSLYLAREYLQQQDTLLLESDLIFEDDVLKVLIEDPHPSLALVAKYASWMDGTVVTLREDCSIKDFLDKAHFRFEDIDDYYKTVNIYKFSQHFSQNHYVPFLEAYSKALGNNEYYEQVLKVITLLDRSEIKALPLKDEVWYEIDDIQDLDIAESMFAPSPQEKLAKIQSRYGGYWRYPHMLDFCYLVNPFFPPQKLLDEIKANFETLTAEYPSGQRVNSLLAAKFFGVSQARIVVGNGAAELIKSLMECISGSIGVILPTFEEYPNRKKAELITFTPANDDYSYTAQDIMQFFGDKDIAAMVIVNPDNPSGNYLPHKDILTLAEWAEKKKIMLVVDESFVDFASLDDTLLVDEVLEKYSHLVVMKSISKSYGVPGFRLGVLASGNEELIQYIKKDVSIWNINSFGEFYLQIAEKYKSNYTQAIERFYLVRDEFASALGAIPGIKVIPSKANYITFRLTNGATSNDLATQLLAKQDILVKDLNGKNGIVGEYVRVAVKTPEENERLLDGLREYFGA